MSAEPTLFSLDAVGAPLIILTRGGSSIAAINAALRDFLRDTRILPSLPCPTEDVLGLEAAEQLKAMLGSSAADQAPVRCRLGPQGRAVLLHPARLPQPEESWLITVVPDLEEEERRLAASHAELQATLDWLPIGVEIMDDDFRTVMLNQHERNLLGYSVEDTMDLDTWWQLAYPDPDYRDLVRTSWTDAVALAQATNSEMVPQEWQVCCKDGTRKTIQFRYRAVGSSHVNVYLDVTRERQLEAMLLDMATTDSLTGLYNRRYFFEKGTTYLRSAVILRQPLSVLVIDVDHFKRVNDRYGHAAGDAVLQAVARRCRAALRKTDVLARIGGEEFAAILPGTTTSEALEIAERMRQDVAVLPVSVTVGDISVTLSIGGTSAIGDERELDELLERADRALYVAKDLGRNRVQFSGQVLVELFRTGSD